MKNGFIKKTALVYYGYSYNPEVNNLELKNLHSHMNKLEWAIMNDMRSLNEFECFFFSGSINTPSKNTRLNDLKPSMIYFLAKFRKPILRDLSIMVYTTMSIFKLLRKHDVVCIVINNHHHYQLPILIANIFSKRIKQINFLVDYPHSFIFEKKRLMHFIEDSLSEAFFSSHKSYIFLGKPYNHESLFPNMSNYINYQYPIIKDYLKPYNGSFIPNLSNKLIISYIGALEDYYCIDFLIELAQYLPHPFEIVVYGRGNKQKEIIKASSVIERLHYRGYLNEQELIVNTAGSFAFLLFTCGRVHNYQVPSKLFNYLPYKKPIITNGISTIGNRYLSKLFPIEEFSVTSVINRLIQMKDDNVYYMQLIKSLSELEKLLLVEEDENKVKLSNLIDKVLY